MDCFIPRENSYHQHLAATAEPIEAPEIWHAAQAGLGGQFASPELSHFFGTSAMVLAGGRRKLSTAAKRITPAPESPKSR